MDDTRFDGIIIGGGQNGLITAAYLAKAGLRIGVFERRPEAGGGMVTVELSAPGYRFNTHILYSKLDDSPVPWDLELARYGVSSILPNPKKAFVRRDSYFVYYQNVEQTYEAIKRFSAKDAETFKRVAKQWYQWYVDFILPDMYSAPKPLDQWVAEFSRIPGGKEYINVALNYTPMEYATELFESDFCRMALLRASGFTEYEPTSKGIPPLVFSTIVNWLIGKTVLIRGGTKRFAEALEAVIREHGGKIFTNQPVTRIIVKNGAARGVAFADGREVYAERFVASNIDPVHTFLFMVGDEHLTDEVRERLANYRFSGTSLFRVHLALKEKPIYAMSKNDPDVNDAWMYTIGFETQAGVLKMSEQARAGQIPDCEGVGAGLIHDPSQAPSGCYVIYLGIAAPFDLADGGAARWADVVHEAGDQLVAKFQEYATNITNDKIAGRFDYSPKDIEEYLPNLVNADINQGKLWNPDQMGENRPWPGMSRYRTFIDKLYLCGACTHPGGLACGAPGYNAANAIAEDLGIVKWWPTYDARKIVVP
jgi:phytoene dehydrogenase-like protein